MSHITIMIPALLGSTRIPDKNVYLVNGYPMMHYVIKSAQQADNVDKIVVNTEDEILLKMADLQKVELFRRNKKKGGSKCEMKNKSMNCKADRCQVHDHFIYDYLINNPTDYLVQIHTTSPLIKTETINQFINELVEKDYDSQFSVINVFEESFFKLKPINFNLNKKEQTQELKPINQISWALSGWKVTSFIESYENNDLNDSGPTFCGKIGFFPISKIEGLDADTNDDLFIIEAVLAHKRKMSNFLKHKFNENIIEIDSNLKNLIKRDGVENVFELIENNSHPFKTSVKEINNQMDGDSWCFPLFYNMTDQICLIKQNKDEGCRKHCHTTKGEWWFVLAGQFNWIIEDGDSFIVNEGEFIYLPPGTIHQILCISDVPGIRMAGGAKDMEHIYVK